MVNWSDLIGQKFGRLTVVDFDKEKIYKDGNKYTTFCCICDCGNQSSVVGYRLLSGGTKSCGCLQREAVSKLNKSHGETKSRLHNIWCRMKQRCYNKNATDYKYYGGKGVGICQEWFSSYQAFRDWSLENGYDETLTIDRIDSGKDYSPDNCRWVDRKMQTKNRSITRLLTFNNETLTIGEWAERIGINSKTIAKRIDVLGWTVEEALTTPKKVKVGKDWIIPVEKIK